MTNPLRIIIADDEGVIRMGLKAMALSMGHKVVATARTGEETIEKVKQFEPDLLLLDIKMPGMDGLSVARMLAKEAPLPIVMLTAYSQSEFIEQAAKTLVMGYLVKPVDEAKLAPSIDMAVDKFKTWSTANAEVAQLKKQLAGQNTIGKARSLLISQGMTEDEAYHYLQAAARKRRLSLADLSQRVINRGGRLG